MSDANPIAGGRLCVCKYCGVILQARTAGRGRQPSTCEACKVDLARARQRRRDRSGEYMRMGIEDRRRCNARCSEIRKRRKAVDPAYRQRLCDQKRRRRARIAAAQGRVLGMYRPSFEEQQDRIALANALQAWRYWIRVRAPDVWLDAYYSASHKPWLDHRLTDSQERLVRYGADPCFRDRERRRLAVKKRERRFVISSSGGLTYKQTYRLLVQAKHCRYCGVALDARNRTLDHVLALSMGGTHTRDNLVHACRSCNSSKQDRASPKRLCAA
jgi:5-methylcytosine-specific restriction endonuclease McrA